MRREPDALGTSRVISLDPAEFKRVGTIEYKQTLPLEDHEVVLTFDDGPIDPIPIKFWMPSRRSVSKQRSLS